MMAKRYEAVEALKEYFSKKSALDYSSVMQRAQRDSKFEDMIIAMTLGRSLGKSSLEKFKCDFSYRPEGE